MIYKQEYSTTWFRHLYNAYVEKNNLMYDISEIGLFYEERFRFDTICNIIQELQELQRLCLLVHRQVCCDTISLIAVKSYTY